MINFDATQITHLNNSQQRAIRSAINYAVGGKQTAADHEIVHTVTLEFTDYGRVWISINSDMPSLGEDNALRSFTRMDSWFIAIGKRGAITAHVYPNAFRAWKGTKHGAVSYS